MCIFCMSSFTIWNLFIFKPLLEFYHYFIVNTFVMYNKSLLGFIQREVTLPCKTQMDVKDCFSCLIRMLEE